MASNNNQVYQQSVNEFVNSLHTDSDAGRQPKGTHRFALNAVNQAIDGKYYSLTNEESNYAPTVIPQGFDIIGSCYMEDDLSAVILKNEATGEEIIGTLNKINQFVPVVETRVLGLSVRYQCDIIYRLRRGSERVIYWVDGNNKARVFNFTKYADFYTIAYTTYLKAGGNPALYIAEKWDRSSFDLVKSYASVPFFSTINILESGSIASGSYNFAIQYIDEDLNPTEWITTSNTVNIFNDTLTNPFHRVRGSKTVITKAQNFPRASKSIRLQITNLDINYPFYRVAIIQSIDSTGLVTKTYASDLISTTQPTYVYTGNDSELTSIELTDILIDREIIFAPNHIEQIENRLLLADTKGKNIDWCAFQKYASKIGSDLVTKEVILNSVESKPNPKNPNSTFIYWGNMPGEVYSYGAAYLFDDGYISPVFHIPGKNSTNSTSKMLYHEIDSKYLDVHNCLTGTYWGQDAAGEDLTNRKIRHHRFPFRKDVNKPLVTSTTGTSTTNRYRLTVVVTLNPAWTPGPPEFPNSGGFPLDISYTFTYKTTIEYPYNNILVSTDINRDLIVYDDVEPLSFVSGTDYVVLDPACELATYQVVGNKRFLMAVSYEVYTVTSTDPIDSSEIFGIRFSDIERPHPNVVGVYIVRNERLPDDRMVVDTAIFGAMTEYQDYKSFGLLTPRPYYTANNCGRIETTTKVVQYEEQTSWFFNPEFHFMQDKSEFDIAIVEGVYEQTSVNMPSECTGNPSSTDQLDGAKGVYVQDVQAGTSFDSRINKGADSDGFDLLIGYRNTNVKFIANVGITFPAKKRIIRLDATAYQIYNSKTYYNVSVDNKISMFLTDTDSFADLYWTGTKSRLIYASLTKSNTSSYSNFISRPYYKEHNNPFMFGTSDTINNVDIFNGDAQISAINLVSSVYYNMLTSVKEKKSRVWQIIVGGILAVAAVVVALIPGGAVISPILISLAISYGVSLAVAGLKFEQMKKMIDLDYEKGLRETISDGGVFETIRESVGRRDDTIRWFADRISNVYMETSVPMALRVGVTSSMPDFIDGPATYNEEEFRSYLTEKLTTIDRENASGRVYKGFASAEFYDANKDFIRHNKEKVFIHLPIEYDCCSGETEKFATRIWNSEQSFQEELTDNYRVILPNNYRDVEGEHGGITDLYKLGNSLFIHTREALYQLPQNIQERVTGDIVSFVGTGTFFSIPPVKVLDDTLGSGGTQHKWSTIKNRQGVFFVNEVEHNVYHHGQGLKDITKGHREWFKNNLKSFLSIQLLIKFGIEFLNLNNPANRNGIGYHSVYDSRYNRMIFTKKDYQVLSTKISNLQLVNSIPTGGELFTYCTFNGVFYLGTQVVHLDNTEFFENKSWTLSYSLHNNQWISYHSYLPNFYIQTQNNFYSFVGGLSFIWKHGRVGHYQTFYDRYCPFIVECVKLRNPLEDSIFEDMTIQTRARKYDSKTTEFYEERFVTFNKITVYNERQCSGEQEMIVKDTQPDPANWYRQQIVNSNTSVLITRKERDWMINNFRDYVNDYSKPMFTKEWAALNGEGYYIDKVVNADMLDFNKSWYELESFRDKYIIIRLKFDNFDNISLILNYSIETEQPTNQ